AFPRRRNATIPARFSTSTWRTSALRTRSSSRGGWPSATSRTAWRSWPTARSGSTSSTTPKATYWRLLPRSPRARTLRGGRGEAAEVGVDQRLGVLLEREAPGRQHPIGDEARDERHAADCRTPRIHARGQQALLHAGAKARLDRLQAFALARGVALA